MQPDLASLGIGFSEVSRTASRRGVSLRLTATQATLLHWWNAATDRTLAACCADNWATVSPDWVRSQWDKLAAGLSSLGCGVEIDADGTIRVIDHTATPVEALAAADAALAAAVARLTEDRDRLSEQLAEQREIARRLQSEADQLRADLDRARRQPADADPSPAPATAAAARAVLIEVPVSQRTARWIEDRAARNGRTPGMFVQALIVALQRATAKREAA